MADNQRLLALLIDGDNVHLKAITNILRKVREYGEPRIARVFHNKATIEQWEQIAGEYSMDAIWVPNNTAQKNAVDIALVMDAMRVFYERPDITGFCIVASDGDFTRVAKHLKSEGKFVLGIGNRQTPLPFRSACTEFIYVEDLVNTAAPVAPPTSLAADVDTPRAEISRSDLLKMFRKAYKQVIKNGNQDEEGRVKLRDIRDAMRELDAMFSSPHYQFMPALVIQVKALAKAYPDTIFLEKLSGSSPAVHYVQIKPVNGKAVAGEIAKFRKAYKHAADVLKHSDKDGWVALGEIGNTLLTLYPDYQRFIYREIKYMKLKEVVEKMVGDYPEFIELNTDGKDARIRFKK